jgi:amino acid adenylation domain-containing protein
MTNLYEPIAAVAGRAPGATAIEFPGEVELSYGELDQRVQELAGWLRGTGIGAGFRVALSATTERETYVAYLACLAVEATVVPFNPSHPPARLEALAASVQASLIVSSAASQEAAACVANATGAGQIVLGDGGSPTTIRPVTTLPESDPFAYILFTSGSTGRPKGVPILPDQVRRYAQHAITRYGFGEGDRLSQCFQLTFDPAVFDLMVGLGAGSTLIVPGEAESRQIVQWVRERDLTSWFYVPTAAAQALRMGELRAGAMPSLRWSLFCGEGLPLKLARTWSLAAPASTVENLYGPTELTITCAAYRLASEHAAWPRTANGTVPIGDVNPGADWCVLDEQGMAAPEGELCVKGWQRFAGYLDRRDDAGRFVAPPSPTGRHEGRDSPEPDHYYRTGDRVRLTDDGMLFLGRDDDQVKLAGYRIELPEIEFASLELDGMITAAAVMVAAPTPKLHLYFVSGEVDEDELRTHLFNRLPRYMVPRALHRVDALPLTAHGKVDRLALKLQAELVDG